MMDSLLCTNACIKQIRNKLCPISVHKSPSEINTNALAKPPGAEEAVLGLVLQRSAVRVNGGGVLPRPMQAVPLLPERCSRMTAAAAPACDQRHEGKDGEQRERESKGSHLHPQQQLEQKRLLY
jgi:hypothetical protein